MHPHTPCRKHAFGNALSTPASQSGAVSTDTRYCTAIATGYTGQRQEPELGLYFYNARWYDPYLARFTQPDTIVPNPVDAKAFDRYAYVYNNPVRYNDPSGHMCSDPEDPTPECENGQIPLEYPNNPNDHFYFGWNDFFFILQGSVVILPGTAATVESLASVGSALLQFGEFAVSAISSGVATAFMGVAVVGTLVSGDTVSPDKLIFVDTGAETAQLEGTDMIDSSQSVLTNDVDPSIGANYLPGFNFEGAPTLIHTGDTTLTLDISSTYLPSNNNRPKSNTEQNSQAKAALDAFIRQAGITVSDEQYKKMARQFHDSMKYFGDVGYQALVVEAWNMFGDKAKK
jgi:RHS repeat-associated protein